MSVSREQVPEGAMDLIQRRGHDGILGHQLLDERSLRGDHKLEPHR